MNKRGIGLAVHYKPIHKLTYYKSLYNFSNQDYPRSNELYESIISLPIYPDMNDDEVNYVTQSIKKLYNIFSI